MSKGSKPSISSPRWPGLARTVGGLLLACHAGPGIAAHASVAAPVDLPVRVDTSAWVAVDAGKLARMRGGFIDASGLEVSLGIERLVTLNGNIVSRTALTIPDIATLSADQAREAESALSSINLVRSGSDTMTLPPTVTSVPGATLIQNSMDGQHIDSHTVINSSVNTLGLLTSLNFQGSLGDAIARSARPF